MFPPRSDRVADAPQRTLCSAFLCDSAFHNSGSFCSLPETAGTRHGRIFNSGSTMGSTIKLPPRRTMAPPRVQRTSNPLSYLSQRTLGQKEGLAKNFDPSTDHLLIPIFRQASFATHHSILGFRPRRLSPW
jgi:hypothetical protein